MSYIIWKHFCLSKFYIKKPFFMAKWWNFDFFVTIHDFVTHHRYLNSSWSWSATQLKSEYQKIVTVFLTVHKKFSKNFTVLCEFTFNSLFISRIHFQFTIYFANLLSIHYLFRELTFHSLSIPRIYFQFTIYSAN